MSEYPKVTVGELIKHLQVYNPDQEVTFSGGLTFYRTKLLGPSVVNIEFNEAQAMLDPKLDKAIQASFLKP